MVCDTRLYPGQTIKDRATQIRDTVAKYIAGLISGKIKPIVSPGGGIAFSGVPETEKNGITDACVYRRVMASGSIAARQKIEAAERLAGKKVSPQAIGHGGAGLHSHDGGKTWHHGH